MVEPVTVLVAFRLAHRRLRRLQLALPLRLLLPHLGLGQPLRRLDQRDAVPDDQVELAVAVDVRDPDARGVRRPLQVRLPQHLAVLDRGGRLDQRPERFQHRRLALAGDVLGPVDAAVGGPADEVEGAVAVDVHDERVAVGAGDLQRLAVRQDRLGLRGELALALALEPEERAREVADDQVELAVAVPVDREGAGADLVRQVLFPVARQQQHLAVATLERLRLPEGAVLLAVQHLEQPGHVLLHPGVGAGEDVSDAVPVDVHELWSGGRASPHARHLGRLAIDLDPLAGAELQAAEVREGAHLAAVELADDERRLAADLGPRGAGVAGRLDADRRVTRLQHDGGVEFRGAARRAAREHEGRQQVRSHRAVLRGCQGEDKGDSPLYVTPPGPECKARGTQRAPTAGRVTGWPPRRRADSPPPGHERPPKLLRRAGPPRARHHKITAGARGRLAPRSRAEAFRKPARPIPAFASAEAGNAGGKGSWAASRVWDYSRACNCSVEPWGWAGWTGCW